MITAHRLPHALAAVAAILSASCEKATPEHRDAILSSGPSLFRNTAGLVRGVRHDCSIAPDGRWAIYADAAGTPRILDLKSGRPVPKSHWAGIDSAWSASFGPRSRIAWLGRRGTEVGWFTADSAVVSRLEGVPKDARPEWSRDGRVAWTRSRGTTEEVVVGSGSTEHAYPLPARAVVSPGHPTEAP